MFYCNQCAKENGWPTSVMRWRSFCEVCDVFSSDCNDIPSRALTPVKDRDGDAAEQEGK